MILSTKWHYLCRCSLPSVMWLLHRMECAQSVTWCEAAAVFARPATPLRLSHCINSRNSTPKAWKRHTPLSLLQDPENPQIPVQEPERERPNVEQMHCRVFSKTFFLQNILYNCTLETKCSMDHPAFCHINCEPPLTPKLSNNKA